MNDNEMIPVGGGWPTPDPSSDPSFERPAIAPVKPSRRSRFSRTALITAAVTALAVSAAVAVAADPTASPAASPAAGTTTEPVTGAADGDWIGRGWIGGDLRGGPGGHMGGLFNPTIAAINGANISLQTDNGWSRTVDTTDVPITRSGEAITLADLAVGDSIRLMEERDDAGNWSVTGIAVVLPHVAGTVESITADTLTVRQPDGSSQAVTLTADTAYKLGDSDGTVADVTAGLLVEVEGTQSGDTFTATLVRAAPAFLGGTVTATTADTITVDQRDGTSATINVDAATEYAVRGVEGATLADIAVDDMVMATGRLNADGSLDATHVFSGVGFMDGRGPGGLGGPGFGGPARGHGFGHGFGGPGWPGGDPSDTDPNATPDPSADPGT